MLPSPPFPFRATSYPLGSLSSACQVARGLQESTSLPITVLWGTPGRKAPTAKSSSSPSLSFHSNSLTQVCCFHIVRRKGVDYIQNHRGRGRSLLTYPEYPAWGRGMSGQRSSCASPTMPCLFVAQRCHFSHCGDLCQSRGDLYVIHPSRESHPFCSAQRHPVAAAGST